MDYRVVRRRQLLRKGNVVRDDLIRLKGPKSKELYPELLRRVVVIIELKGELVEMAFLTNNMEWSAQTIADLYRCRWDIEEFFKQIKQSLQLCDFLGNSSNAVHWQIWIALLVYVLLRYLAFLSRWTHSFTRLWAVVRTALWRKINLIELISSYGIAWKPPRIIATPEQAYFAGF
jgi:IS4 transposase